MTYNALTFEVANRCEVDPEIRAVVRPGNGRMFCAGGDLKSFVAQGERVSSHVMETPTPSIPPSPASTGWMRR